MMLKLGLMVGIIPSKSHSSPAPVARPRLRLVTNDPSQQANTSVMVCLSACSSGNSDLLRKASAAARENDAELYAVLVDSQRTRFGSTQLRSLIDDTVLAIYLGAKIVWLESSDVVGELLRFARQSSIGRIFVARTRPAPFPRLFEGAVYSELLRRSEGLRIDVVGLKHRN